MAARKGPQEKEALPLVAYLCGEERLLVEDAFERLRTRALAEVQAPDFNHDRVSARGTGIHAILNLCRTLPVMSPRRLVEVREAEAIPTADHDVLIEYLKAPDPQCTLILVGAGADKRLRLFKEVMAAGFLRIHDKPKEAELPDWLQLRSRRFGITLTDGAADSLAAAIGAELMLLERSLEKLRLVVGEGGTVTEEHVATHVAQTRVETSFKIVDAMAAGNMGEALFTMLSVVDAGESPIRLLGALAYAQRNSIRFLDRLVEGASINDAARECRIFNNAHAAATRVKAAGRRGLTEGLVALAQAERALKSSGGADDEAVLVDLLHKLKAAQTRGKASA